MVIEMEQEKKRPIRDTYDTKCPVRGKMCFPIDVNPLDCDWSPVTNWEQKPVAA